MIQKYIRIADLIYKESFELLLQDEKEELLDWLKESEHHLQLYYRILKDNLFSNDFSNSQDGMYEEIWKNIEQKISFRHHLFTCYKIGYVASVLILLAIGSMCYLKTMQEEWYPEFMSVVPGQQYAVLYLASGEKLELLHENRVIVEDTLLGKIEQLDKVLIYKTDSCGIEEQYNTLEIPNSGEFQIVLSDGTRVWLNAGTKFTYPINFAKNKREVYLDGEAYFDVVEDPKKTFVVHVNGMEVNVLGTSFNLKSFVEDKQTIVTLLKGKVEIKTSLENFVLKPNQQAELWIQKNCLTVREADLKSVLAWRNNMFIFKNVSLEYMMKELERWFDVEVEFESEELRRLRVYIYIERSKTLKDVLDKITSIDEIRWRIEGKKIILKNDKKVA